MSFCACILVSIVYRKFGRIRKIADLELADIYWYSIIVKWIIKLDYCGNKTLIGIRTFISDIEDDRQLEVSRGEDATGILV